MDGRRKLLLGSKISTPIFRLELLEDDFYLK